MGLASETAGVYEFGPFTVDPLRRLLLRGSLPMPVQPKVFDTLLYMVENPDRLLTKDELLAAIWPGRVVEESNLSQNVFTLRKVLNDGGDERCIVTAPGRGYRFTAPVRRVNRSTNVAGPGAAAALAAPAAVLVPVRSKWAIRSALLAAALALLIGALLYALAHRPRGVVPAMERSRILLSGMVNLTDDPAFNAVPGNVLEIGLSQSPFLSLISQKQLQNTLRLMERPADTKLSAELAREICLRNQGKAVLSGAIAAFGSRYVVTLEASDCSSGERILQSKAEASRKEEVPHALDSLAMGMRTTLGESLASIRKYGVPIEQATTGSFDALQAFSVGEQARLKGDNHSAAVLFKRAVELDPSFALAYAQLAGAYAGLREIGLARGYYQKAFALKDRASEREQLWISAEYFKLVGNLSASVDSYRTLTQLYPSDARPWAALAGLYTRQARYNDAVDAAKQGLALNPDDSRAYVSLARAYKRLNRFVDAIAIGEQATAKGLDAWDMHCLLYEVAFALGDVGMMADEVAKESGKQSESWMLDYEALAAATGGRLKQARALFERAIALAETSGGEDGRATLSNFYTDYIQMLAMFGLRREAQQVAAKAIGLEQNEEAPYALAEAGEFERAASLDREIGQQYPDSTLVSNLIRPRTQAAIALGQRRPRDAIVSLQPAIPTKMATFDVPSMLGQAYLALKQPEQAAAEYRDVLANRGVDATSPRYPFAYLGLARARSMQGNVQESRAAYEQLFAFWKDSDPDNPVLVRARGEYARLGQ